MNTETENPSPVHFPEVGEAVEDSRAGTAALRRAFVEPEVSCPVEVLETTTFFQFTDSGVTLP